LLDSYGVDAVRYFLLRDGGLSDDANFSDEDVIMRLNSDLADNLGNLVARCTAPAILPDCALPLLSSSLSVEDQSIIDDINSIAASVSASFEKLEFGSGLQSLFAMLSRCNAYFQQQQPWELRRSDEVRANTALHICLEAVRVAALLLMPIIPSSSARLLDFLHVPLQQRSFAFARFGRDAGVRFQMDPSSASTPSSFILFRKFVDPLAVQRQQQRQAAFDPDKMSKKKLKKMQKAKSTEELHDQS